MMLINHADIFMQIIQLYLWFIIQRYARLIPRRCLLLVISLLKAIIGEIKDGRLIIDINGGC